MKQIKIVLAAAIALAAMANGRLLAADTNQVVSSQATVKTPTTGMALAHGWYGPGADGKTGYFNPAITPQSNPYPYYNVVVGQAYGPLYQNLLPNQNESPFNPAAALSRHYSGASGFTHVKPAFVPKNQATQPAAQEKTPGVH